jgi:hypothetical protein
VPPEDSGKINWTHSDGEILLVELLLVQDVLGLEHRLEDVRLPLLVALGCISPARPLVAGMCGRHIPKTR